jgi:hypothetical protein
VGMVIAWQKKKALKQVGHVPAEEKVDFHE